MAVGRVEMGCLPGRCKDTGMGLPGLESRWRACGWFTPAPIGVG